MKKTPRWWASPQSADYDGYGDDDDCEIHLRGGHPLEVMMTMVMVIMMIARSTSGVGIPLKCCFMIHLLPSPL